MFSGPGVYEAGEQLADRGGTRVLPRRQRLNGFSALAALVFRGRPYFPVATRRRTPVLLADTTDRKAQVIDRRSLHECNRHPKRIQTGSCLFQPALPARGLNGLYSGE